MSLTFYILAPLVVLGVGALFYHLTICACERGIRAAFKAPKE